MVNLKRGKERRKELNKLKKKTIYIEQVSTLRMENSKRFLNMSTKITDKLSRSG